MKQNIQFETVAISSIKPYWRNPRRNTHVVEGVAESIKKFGYSVPIVVDRNMVILKGHTTYRALTKLGHTEIKVVVADLSESKARQFRIADNKTSEWAEWNPELLKSELAAVESIAKGFFEDEEWAKIMDVSTLEDGLEQPEKPDEGGYVYVPEKIAVCPYCGTEHDLEDIRKAQRGEDTGDSRKLAGEGEEAPQPPPKIRKRSKKA